jgi:hypothetical protein
MPCLYFFFLDSKKHLGKLCAPDILYRTGSCCSQFRHLLLFILCGLLCGACITNGIKDRNWFAPHCCHTGITRCLFITSRRLRFSRADRFVWSFMAFILISIFRWLLIKNNFLYKEHGEENPYTLIAGSEMNIDLQCNWCNRHNLKKEFWEGGDEKMSRERSVIGEN